MAKQILSIIMIALLGVAGGCDQSKESSKSDLKTTDTEPVVTGTLKVLGSGADLYYVYDATGENKINFTKTGAPLKVPAGPCLVILNGTQQKVTVKEDELIELPSGTLRVVGIGQDLYEVYENSGANKLNFTRTNNAMAFFEGTYSLRLNNTSQEIAVCPGEETIINAGTIIVEGDGKELYEVYDKQGSNKLGFTRTGKAMELLPGDYMVTYNQKNYTATVKANEQTTVMAQ